MLKSESEVRRLVLLGAGGLGQEVAWAARRANRAQLLFELIGYCDDDQTKKGSSIDGLDVLGSLETCGLNFEEKTYFIAAVGNNRRRESLSIRALNLGLCPATVIDPSVVIGDGMCIDDGSYIGALCVLSPHSRIGSHVIVNQGCTIGHHSTLADFSQVCPGGRISGHCTLGRGAFVGSNGVLAPGTSLGDAAVLGAASFASRDIPPGATAVGNPARIVFKSPLPGS